MAFLEELEPPPATLHPPPQEGFAGSRTEARAAPAPLIPTLRAGNGPLPGTISKEAGGARRLRGAGKSLGKEQRAIDRALG